MGTGRRTTAIAIGCLLAALAGPASAGAGSSVAGTYGCAVALSGIITTAADSQIVLTSTGRYRFTRNGVNGAPAPSKGKYTRSGSKLTFSGGALAPRHATFKTAAGFRTLSFSTFPGTPSLKHRCTSF